MGAPIATRQGRVMIQTNPHNGREITMFAMQAEGMVIAQPPYGYRAYGLTIRSDLELPELEPEAAESPDVTIRLRPTGRPLPHPSGSVVFEFSADTQYLAWPGVGGFLIRGTNAIDIEPAAGVSTPLLNFPLLGPVFALLLHLRGMLVLHASAIEVAGRGAIFLGDKGAGKSTTAAALVAAGHRLLIDDVLALDFSDPNGPRIAPGFPQLKLTDATANKIIIDGAVAMPPPIPDFPKQQRRLTGPFLQSHALPGCIYVLMRGPLATTRPMSVQDALSALMRFSYLPLLQQRPLSRLEAGAHLKQCATLAGSVRICTLELPTDLDRLGEIVQLIERDLM